MDKDPQTSQWHLDKRVPVALILTLIVQGAAMVWWGSAIDHRVAAVEQRLSALDDSRERLIRLEASVSYQQQVLQEIRDELKSRP
jgi:hypothetical protein